MTDFHWPMGNTGDSVYAETERELEALTAELQAIGATKIYVGGNPYDGLSTDTLLNLDDWR